MAGIEAERLFGFSDDGGGKNDLAEARAQLSDAKIEAARATARRMLKANLVALIAITVALLEKRSLDADEIAAIMGGNDDGGDMWTRIRADQRQIHHGAPELIPRPLDRDAAADPEVQRIRRHMQAGQRALDGDYGPIFERISDSRAIHHRVDGAIV